MAGHQVDRGGGAPDRRPPGGTSPTLDLAVLKELRSLQEPGEGDLLAELVGIFLEDSPGRLEELRHAVGAGDAHAARLAVHGLRGSSSNVGARRLQDLCAAFEALARSRFSEAAAREALAALEAEFARVRQAFRELGLPPPATPPQTAG